MATFQYSVLEDGASTAFNPDVDVLNFDQTTILPYDVYMVRDENVGGGSADDLSVAIIDGPQAGKHVFLLDMDAKQVTTSNFTFASGGGIFAGDNTTGTSLDDAGNFLRGTLQNDLIIGFGGDDQLNGRDGNDVFAFYLGADGHYGMDTVSGADGIDTLRFLDQGAVGATVNLTLGTMSGGDIDGTSGAVVKGIENIAGTILADNLTGNSIDNLIIGRDGADTLNGGTGADTIEGGTGNDSIVGGGGFDTADYQHGASGIDINMATGGTDGDGGTDTLATIEGIIGSAFGDDVTGTTGANTFDMRNGDDSVHAGRGADTMYGGDGNDQLWGGAGNDSIYGAAGDDIYWGGNGADTLVGSGSSTFQPDAVATVGMDTIRVLTGTEGMDVVFAFDTDKTGGVDANVDQIDLRSLFNSIGYTGTDPIADGYMKIENGSGFGATGKADAVVSVDLDGGGDTWTAILQIVDVSRATMLADHDYFLFQ